ncbi:DUF1758 domain-containing protein [Trichonephila clavipes]|nr:DUF1758 domain-containing protein [Trichonephila clavipes]
MFATAAISSRQTIENKYLQNNKGVHWNGLTVDDFVVVACVAGSVVEACIDDSVAEVASNRRKKIDKLNNSKRAIKGTITRIETFVEESRNYTPTKLYIKLKRVQEMNRTTDELKDQYYDIKDISESELEVIEADIQSMEDRLEELEVRIRDILNSLIAKSSVIFVHNHENAISQANSKLKLEIKLPEIPLPVFRGRYDEWPSFKSQFDNIITNNNDLIESQKLYYLKASLHEVMPNYLKQLMIPLNRSSQH